MNHQVITNKIVTTITIFARQRGRKRNGINTTPEPNKMAGHGFMLACGKSNHKAPNAHRAPIKIKPQVIAETTQAKILKHKFRGCGASSCIGEDDGRYAIDLQSDNREVNRIPSRYPRDLQVDEFLISRQGVKRDPTPDA